MRNLAIKHAEKLRYGVVGVSNTILDFSILFLLVNLGLDKIIANYISTFTAFIFSFFLNKSYTFKSVSGNAKKQFGLFFIVTLFGLWVIQPVVIYSMSLIFSETGLQDGTVLLISKLTATIASLIWNYLFYSRIVFKKES